MAIGADALNHGQQGPLRAVQDTVPEGPGGWGPGQRRNEKLTRGRPGGCAQRLLGAQGQTHRDLPRAQAPRGAFPSTVVTAMPAPTPALPRSHRLHLPHQPENVRNKRALPTTAITIPALEGRVTTCVAQGRRLSNCITVWTRRFQPAEPLSLGRGWCSPPSVHPQLWALRVPATRGSGGSCSCQTPTSW